MKLMVVVNLCMGVSAAVTIPRGKTLQEVFERWYASDQNNRHECEEDLIPCEVELLKYKDLTIEDEE